MLEKLISGRLSNASLSLSILGEGGTLHVLRLFKHLLCATVVFSCLKVYESDHKELLNRQGVILCFECEDFINYLHHDVYSLCVMPDRTGRCDVMQHRGAGSPRV